MQLDQALASGRLSYAEHEPRFFGISILVVSIGTCCRLIRVVRPLRPTRLEGAEQQVSVHRKHGRGTETEELKRNRNHNQNICTAQYDNA